jgi:hypothetical protein
MVVVVGDEPKQASDELWRRRAEAAASPERLDESLDETRAFLADDYVHIDRRSIVGLPDLDGAGFIESLRIGHEAGLEQLDRQVVARRGDRLVLSGVTTRFADGSEKQYLVLIQWDRAVAKIERMVRFDPDDLDTAMTELDRMHAEIEANDMLLAAQ